MALSNLLRLLLTAAVWLRPQPKPPAKAARKDGGSFSVQCVHLLMFFSSRTKQILSKRFLVTISSHVTQTDPLMDPTHWPLTSGLGYPGGRFTWEVALASICSAPQAAGRLACLTGIPGFSAGNSKCHPLERLRVGLFAHSSRHPPKPTGTQQGL